MATSRHKAPATAMRATAPPDSVTQIPIKPQIALFAPPCLPGIAAADARIHMLHTLTHCFRTKKLGARGGKPAIDFWISVSPVHKPRRSPSFRSSAAITGPAGPRKVTGRTSNHRDEPKPRPHIARWLRRNTPHNLANRNRNGNSGRFAQMGDATQCVQSACWGDEPSAEIFDAHCTA